MLLPTKYYYINLSRLSRVDDTIKLKVPNYFIQSSVNFILNKPFIIFYQATFKNSSFIYFNAQILNTFNLCFITTELPDHEVQEHFSARLYRFFFFLKLKWHSLTCAFILSSRWTFAWKLNWPIHYWINVFYVAAEWNGWNFSKLFYSFACILQMISILCKECYWCFWPNSM